MSPFDKSYTPKIDAKALTRESQISANSTKSREKLMGSADPKVRAQASGYIPGMSGASATFADRRNGKV